MSWHLALYTGAFVVSIARAQDFTSLNKTIGYLSLEGCEQDCLTPFNSPPRYDNLLNAESNCGNFNQAPGALDACLQTGCSDEPPAAVNTVQNVLSSYCSYVSTYAATASSASATATPSSTGDTDVTSTGTAEQTGPLSSGVQTLPLTTASEDSVPTPGSSASSAALLTTPATLTTSTATPTATPMPIGNSTGNSTTGSSLKSSNKASEKLGIGLGVGLGLPILLGILAAVFFLPRRRKSRSGPGPYGPVMTSEKGMNESVSYTGPQMDSHEPQHMGSAAPFLPALATRDLPSKEHETFAEREPFQPPLTASTNEAAEERPQMDSYYSVERPATSRDVQRSTTPPPPQSRPMTAPQHLVPPDDEPPSPVSPVSPISPAGSRPASLMHGDEHEL